MSIWNPVVGYEELYLVSKSGQLKSIDRTEPYNRWGATTRTRKGRVIKTILNKDGYPVCCLCKNGNKRNWLVHVLVAKAFITNPGNKEQVNHKNGIKGDNRTVNLEWNTMSENMRHSYRILGRIHPKGNLGNSGALSKSSKPVKQLDRVTLKVINTFPSITIASQNTGINNTVIGMVINNKLKTGGGYKWALA